MNKVQQLGGPDLDLKKNYSTCDLSINFEKLIYNNNHKKLLEFSYLIVPPSNKLSPVRHRKQCSQEN